MNKIILKIALIITIITLYKSHDHTTEEEIKKEIENKEVSYGSVVRLQNLMTKFQMYSNKYTWGSGSQLQIITSVRSKDDPGALWVIKEGHGLDFKEIGVPLKCNDIIRLEHSKTGKNLHSHTFKSFVTNSQEACGFGENGEGDINDNFKLVCYNNKDDNGIVKGKTTFFLQHVPTSKWVHISIKNSLYDERNCRNCPIMYQREVSLTEKKDKQALWNVVGGLMFETKKDD